MTTQKTTAEIITWLEHYENKYRNDVHFTYTYTEMADGMKEAKDRLAELEAALQFYADHSNWDHDTGYKDMTDWAAVCDRGKRAREALQPKEADND